MILWKFTLREVKSRPGRVTLTLLSIVIGVAAVVAVTVGTTTTHQAYREMYENLAGRAALEVAAEGGGFFDGAIVKQIEQTPGVKAVVPSIQKLSALWHNNNHVRLLVMGIDPTRDEAVHDYELKEGAFFREKYDALLETGFAKGLGVGVGDEVKLAATRGGLHGGLKTFRITGLLSPRGAANFNQGGVIFLSLNTASRLFKDLKNPNYVNTVSIVLDGDADEKTVGAAIAKTLPVGLAVRSPMMRAQLTKDTMQDAEKGLNFAYVLMIVLAAFTIFNTFLMNVGERRRQLAVLRAIGATRGQIIRMLLVEGLAMGCVGTVLGSLLGLAGAYGLAQAMGRVYSTTMPSLCITLEPFIVVAVLGPGMSLLAMFVPAWIAGRISPLEGMRFVAAEGHKHVTWKYLLLSVSAFIAGGAALAACILGYLPVQLTVYVGAVFTATFVLLVPIVLGPLTGLASKVLYPVLGVEGRIAQRQVLRRRVRTTLTIGLLYIAASTAISLGTTILNAVNDVRSWQAKTFQGDFIIRTMAPDVNTGATPPMPESLAHEFRAVDGVANVDSIRYVDLSMHAADPAGSPQNVMVFVRDFTDKTNLPLLLQDGDRNPETVREKLSQGEIVLGAVLANRTGTKVGDTITLDTAKGPQKFRVAATATAYLVGGMLIYMEGRTAREKLGIDDVNTFVINALPGAKEQVQERLKPICARCGLLLHSFADLRRRIDSMILGVTASLWGLLALGFIVGAFGIANTLTMNVLEQTRELALLRVVAMTRRQVRKAILAQAVIIGFIGLTLGILGGVVGSYVSNLCSLPLLGHTMEFLLYPSLLVVCFATGLVVIVAAAWVPAERAARLKLLIALQYE
jgi:putative ABC transport system permease protein